MPYDIVIADEAYNRFFSYVDECNTEVAAMGYVTANEEEKFLFVDTIFLVPQEVSGTLVDFLTDGLPYAVQKAIDDDRVDDLRFCIHSHVNMGTTFSNTDDDMIEKMGSHGAPWFASAIFNKKRETNGRVDLFGPSLPLPGVNHIEVKANVYAESQVYTDENVKAELAQFLTISKPKPSKAVATVNPRNGVGRGWRTPMRESDGNHSGTTKSASDSDGYDASASQWWETDLEEELRLQITAKRESWETIEDSEGHVHYFDTNGVWKGSIEEEMDEGTIEWFMSRGWADGLKPLESDADIPEGLS